MELSLKTIAITLAVTVVASFAVGRYTVPSKIVTTTQTTTKTDENKVVNDNDDKDETIDKTIEKDGTIKETIHIVDVDKSTTTDSKQTQSDTTSKTVETNSKNDWNISILATPSRLDDTLMNTGSMGYGVHVQRRILGPFSVGAFGITNKTYGLSLGVSF
jgi:hypothetical protein